MGKKSRRVRGAGATPASKFDYSQVNALVEWKDGDDRKGDILGMVMERGDTIRDVKVKVESMTGVPVARQALNRRDKLLGGEIEVPDHVFVEVDGPMEVLVTRIWPRYECLTPRMMLVCSIAYFFTFNVGAAVIRCPEFNQLNLKF